MNRALMSAETWKGSLYIGSSPSVSRASALEIAAMRAKGRKSPPLRENEDSGSRAGKKVNTAVRQL